MVCMHAHSCCNMQSWASSACTYSQWLKFPIRCDNQCLQAAAGKPGKAYTCMWVFSHVCPIARLFTTLNIQAAAGKKGKAFLPNLDNPEDEDAPAAAPAAAKGAGKKDKKGKKGGKAGKAASLFAALDDVGDDEDNDPVKAAVVAAAESDDEEEQANKMVSTKDKKKVITGLGRVAVQGGDMFLLSTVEWLSSLPLVRTVSDCPYVLQ